MAARFGKEEFVVLTPHIGPAQALLRVEQIRNALASGAIALLPTLVTASFGVAELSGELDGESLLRQADAALHQTKDGGRNRVIQASLLLAA